MNYIDGQDRGQVTLLPDCIEDFKKQVPPTSQLELLPVKWTDEITKTTSPDFVKNEIRFLCCIFK